MEANPGFFRDLAYVFLAAITGGMVAWPHGRRNDYVNDSRTDSGSGFLRVDEGTSAAAWHVAAGDRQ